MNGRPDLAAAAHAAADAGRHVIPLVPGGKRPAIRDWERRATTDQDRIARCWAGGRWNKLALLGGIYVTRSIVLALYFMVPPTPMSTLVFGAFMGFLWLGVGPLVAGAVAELFGLQWQAMIQGLAFMSHQLGSFLGAYGGGVIYDALGSYDMAWRIGVAVGLAAGIVQVAFALIRPTAAPPILRTA